MIVFFSRSILLVAWLMAVSACREGSDIDVKTVNGETTFTVTAPSCVRSISVTTNAETLAPKYSWNLLQPSVDSRLDAQYCRTTFVYGKSYPGYEMQYDQLPLKPGVTYFVQYGGAGFGEVERFKVM